MVTLITDCAGLPFVYLDIWPEDIVIVLCMN